MKAFSWIVIGLVLVFGAGCASSSTTAAAPTGPPANVTGTIEVGGRTDLSGGITGTVRGNMMDYRIANGGAGTMQVSGNVISGVISGNAFRAQKQ